MVPCFGHRDNWNIDSAELAHVITGIACKKQAVLAVYDSLSAWCFDQRSAHFKPFARHIVISLPALAA